MVKPIDVDIKFSNHSDFVYHLDKLFVFQDELIPKIDQGHLLKYKFSYTLEILLPNSSFKQFVIKST